MVLLNLSFMYWLKDIIFYVFYVEHVSRVSLMAAVWLVVMIKLIRLHIYFCDKFVNNNNVYD